MVEWFAKLGTAAFVFFLLKGLVWVAIAVLAARFGWTLGRRFVLPSLRRLVHERHREAINSPFQQRLISGTVTRKQYATWLVQMRAVHEAVEQQMYRFASDRDLEIAPQQWRLARLDQDLANFDHRSDFDHTSDELLDATRVLVRSLSGRSGSTRSLGSFYVLQGLGAGNERIAPRVRGALGLAPGEGDAYLTPVNGPKHAEMFAAFEAQLETVALTRRAHRQVVAGAALMFDGLAAVGDELLAGCD